MSIELLEIAFNHDGSSATGDAFNVRENAHRFAAVPEWRAPGNGGAPVSVACYARDTIGAGPISIGARFARRDPTLDRVEVQAVALRTPGVPPFLLEPPVFPPTPLGAALARAHEAALLLWFAGLAPQPRPSADAVLGDVAATPVMFGPDGLSVPTVFRLTGSLQRQGIGLHDIVWQWRYRRGSEDPWRTFATSRHRIYVTLDVPTAPWQQGPHAPGNTQLPWIEVIDVACRWAEGATTPLQAAARVTRAVNELGGRVLEYDCFGPIATLFGTPHYTLVPGLFHCSEFLERLRGGVGLERFVNCSDCAAIVSTFANALGCDLSQSRMAGPLPFPLNPTRSIGSAAWLSACGAGAFTIHEVAWSGACGINDPLFDACLEVDGDRDPTRPPHVPSLPANVRFGTPGDGQYGDRLVSPPGRVLCQPHPLTRQRRRVI